MHCSKLYNDQIKKLNINFIQLNNPILKSSPQTVKSILLMMQAIIKFFIFIQYPNHIFLTITNFQFLILHLALHNSNLLTFKGRTLDSFSKALYSLLIFFIGNEI